MWKNSFSLFFSKENFAFHKHIKQKCARKHSDDGDVRDNAETLREKNHKILKFLKDFPPQCQLNSPFGKIVELCFIFSGDENEFFMFYFGMF